MNSQLRTPTEAPTVDYPAPENRTPVGRLAVGGLLAATYATTVVAFAALTVGGSVLLASAGGLPVAAQLVLWLLAVAGVAAAPIAGRRVVGSLADRLETVDAPAPVTVEALAVEDGLVPEPAGVEEPVRS